MTLRYNIYNADTLMLLYKLNLDKLYRTILALTGKIITYGIV